MFRFGDIKCVAYGNIVEEMDDLWSNCDEKIVICVLRFWKMHIFNGKCKCVTYI